MEKILLTLPTFSFSFFIFFFSAYNILVSDISVSLREKEREPVKIYKYQTFHITRIVLQKRQYACFS